MSKRTFTEQEVQSLRENQYTYRVTTNMISFTKVFKEIFYKEYLTGKLPRQILEDYGYPVKLFGKQRIWGITQCIKRGFETPGKSHKDVLSGGNSASASKSISAEESIRHLQHEVDYLKQEVEFLKKISSIRSTRK